MANNSVIEKNIDLQLPLIAKNPIPKQDRIGYDYNPNPSGLLDGYEYLPETPVKLTSTVTLRRPKTKSQLKDLLNYFSINYFNWGIGEAKLLDDLYREIQLGIVRFSYNDDMRLCRNIRIAKINVLATIRNKRKRLFESKQVFLDSAYQHRKVLNHSGRLHPNSDTIEHFRCRYRNQPSVNRKVQSGHSVSAIARSALVMELGFPKNIVRDDLQFTPTGIYRNLVPSDTISYPGLPTVYTFYSFLVDLDKNINLETGKRLINPKINGYVDIRDRLVTFFQWQAV